MVGRREILIGGAAAAGSLLTSQVLAGSRRERTGKNQTVWTFDRLSDIGGAATTVEGNPQLVASPFGQAVQFDGVDDRLVIDHHPLAGWGQFTFEALFRPDGGVFAQRWFHLNEEPAGGEPSTTRILFEIRVIETQWCLDAFATGPGYKHTLLFENKLFPVGRWYWVAQSFDGKTYRAFVDGVLQGEAEIDYKPQGAGRSSVGSRLNKVDYFKGAIREARFTPRGLAPDQLQRLG